MKRYIAICSALLLSASFAQAELSEDQCKKITQTVGRLISQIHYRQTGLNDEIAGHHLDRYLNLLDFSHMIFLQSDVDALTKKYGTKAKIGNTTEDTGSKGTTDGAANESQSEIRRTGKATD